MTYYRLYFFGARMGPISDFHEFEANDDRAAIAASERHRRMVAMELWSGGRKVKRWELDGTGARRIAASEHELSSSRRATMSRFA